MSTEFASAGLTMGQLNAIVKKLGGHDMVLRFLRDELIVSEPIRSWREEDDIIYFSVTSDGATGEEWIERLKKKGRRIGDCAKEMLCSTDFKPTSCVVTEIAVLKGTLFSDDERATKNIRDKAYSGIFTNGKKLFDPNAEVACLIREKFTYKEIRMMGLSCVVTMHRPISCSGGNPDLLGAGRGDGSDWLSAYCGRPGTGWFCEDGFAFAVSQVSA